MRAVAFIALARALLSDRQMCAWAEDGNAEKGAKVFNKCMTCHRIGEGAKIMVGPVLTGVVGRPGGHLPGFRLLEPQQGSGREWAGLDRGATSSNIWSIPTRS